jgi:acetyl-CoA carboxylase carboxyl transferase subunit beta
VQPGPDGVILPGPAGVPVFCTEFWGEILMPVRLPFRPRRDAYPPDLWTKCPSCSEMLFNKQLEKSMRVCPHCGHHFRISARARIEQLVDSGSFVERDADLTPVDALGFIDLKAYPDRLMAAHLQTGLRDSSLWGLATMGGKPVSLCVFDFFFMGGSMASVTGEKVTRAAEAALEQRIPLIIVSSSGGARMQEGTYSLMQLAKTMAVVERVKAARVPYISVMTDPTTGGTFASFAVVGDVNLAEPKATIRFAGERVSSGTIAEELPEGYNTSEFQLSHGFVDRIVPRTKLRDEIVALLGFLIAPPNGGQGEALASPASRPRAFFNAIAGALNTEGNGDRSGSNGQTGEGSTNG